MATAHSPAPLERRSSQPASRSSRPCSCLSGPRRIIDHDQRRNEIAAALRRVVLREGMAAVSVRTVAAEAGWSPSAVRHWFPDQAALVRFAVARTMAEAPARLREVLAAGPSRENAQLLLEQLLPLDDVRRVEMHVWLAAVDPARHDDGFDETRSQMFVALRHVCRTAVARWCDLAPPASVGEVVDAVEQDAAVLHALLDGLALHGVHYPEEATPERIRAVLRHHLEAISTRSRL